MKNTVKAAPILVELTEIEQRGYNLAGSAQGDEIRVQIEIILLSEGMEGERLQTTATALANAASRARDKIEEARRFEIRVVPETGVAALPPGKLPKSRTVSSSAKPKIKTY